MADNDNTDNGLAGFRRLYTQDFVDGTEDLEIKVTELVEEWMGGTINNYGFIIKLSGTYEAFHSGSNVVETDGVLTGPGVDASPNNMSLNNHTGSQDSFYTKKFLQDQVNIFIKLQELKQGGTIAKRRH